MKTRTSAFFIGTALATCAFSTQAASAAIETTQSLLFQEGYAVFGNSFSALALNTNFIDSYNFTVPTFSDAFGEVSSRVFKTKGMITKDLDLTGFSLTALNGYSVDGDFGKAGTEEYWSIDAFNLTSGNYTLKVFGTVKTLTANQGNIGYSGSIGLTPIVSAVPEPSTWGMLICGLGVIGFMAKRRIKSDMRKV
jgi:hypothetical protein